ncbi:hypothetical protein PDESU_05029 [Pontiella desulfatans]|uniref:Uncharacterized protein n=1 Tax=Pontiella desulfatans TaxID=2750659 RepID=A0A6C2U8K4_PONDE|nr:hypothetical protein PDESU_05029 [Pontiella desulfatans]
MLDYLTAFYLVVSTVVVVCASVYLMYGVYV